MTDVLAPLFGEFGLIRYRLHVEVEWLIRLVNNRAVPVEALNTETQTLLRETVARFTLKDAEAVKRLENRTQHDVKALEQWLTKKMRALGLGDYAHYVHFGCTSEDITNPALGMMTIRGIKILSECLSDILSVLKRTVIEHAETAMVARTHGMAASPTTYGKEMAVFAHRLGRQMASFDRLKISAKFNGATGNHNALHIAYPSVNWPSEMRAFITGLGCEYNPCTTQIEGYDRLAELLHELLRINNILTDLCRDVWGYAALGYFKQQIRAGEVGSSTMPHKVNPIDFENAEGNFGMANSLAGHCASKLQVSRWQRDLSDSTVLRNLGVVFAHSLIGYKAVLRGLGRLTVQKEALAAELEDSWELLTEAVQTLMRRAGIPNAYTRIKNLTRGQKMSRPDYVRLVKGSGLDTKDQEFLLTLKPADYTGLAAELAIKIGRK